MSVKKCKKHYNFKRKLQIDWIMKHLFQLCAILSSLILLIIIVFIALKGVQPFLGNELYPKQEFMQFLFGNVWRKDQGIYGVGFIVVNTFIACFWALIIASPIAILTALFICKIAPKCVKGWFVSTIELLASIPSVVYGVFACGVLLPGIQNLAAYFHIVTAAGSSLLAVILLLAIMIFPTITSLSISAIEAVSEDLEHASLALGATKTQTNFKIVLLSAKSGIFAGMILGLGRAFGEASAVMMVAGNKMFGPTFNIFDITRTLTTTMLSGLKETNGLDYDIRFSVGLVLMIMILFSNGLLNAMKKKVGKQ